MRSRASWYVLGLLTCVPACDTTRVTSYPNDWARAKSGTTDCREVTGTFEDRGEIAPTNDGYDVDVRLAARASLSRMLFDKLPTGGPGEAVTGSVSLQISPGDDSTLVVRASRQDGTPQGINLVATCGLEGLQIAHEPYVLYGHARRTIRVVLQLAIDTDGRLIVAYAWHERSFRVIPPLPDAVTKISYYRFHRIDAK